MDDGMTEQANITLPHGWRYGFDSASGTAIPISVVNDNVVMGYPDRQPDPWTPDDFERYQDAGASIARITQADPPDWASCSIADWEQGAIFDPPSLRRFVIRRNQFRPGTQTVYSDLDNLAGDLQPPLARVLHGLTWKAWLAHWRPPSYPVPDDAEIDHLQSLLPPHIDLVAVQFRPGSLFDRSVVIDPTWHA
jgi:hypothetical protein